jgi:hypothetical protein
MAAINFPDNPEVNDEFTVNDRTWVYVGNDIWNTAETGEITGPTGPPNTLTVGTVSSTGPDNDPSITITGTSPNQTINFVLKQGPIGPTGPTNLPSQDGNSGKFLSTDGTSAAWSTVDALPSQTGNNGNVLVTDGTSASWTNALQRNFSIFSTSDPLMIQRYVNSAAGPFMYLQKTRSATASGFDSVQNGDSVGGLLFRASDGTKFSVPAAIAVVVDGTPSSTSMPGRIIFQTTPAGSTNTVERVSIDSFGSTNLRQIMERAQVGNTAFTGTISYDILTTGAVFVTTANATGNWNLNLRGNSSTTINSMMTTEQSLTFVVIVPQGSTGYFQNAQGSNVGFLIDGTTTNVTVRWQDGIQPNATVNTNGHDVYTYSIIKTGSATYQVLASKTRFA